MPQHLQPAYKLRMKNLTPQPVHNQNQIPTTTSKHREQKSFYGPEAKSSAELLDRRIIKNGGGSATFFEKKKLSRGTASRTIDHGGEGKRGVLGSASPELSDASKKPSAKGIAHKMQTLDPTGSAATARPKKSTMTKVDHQVHQ